MAERALNPLRITDLSGGIADGHPAQIGDRQVVEAVNVDYWDGKCGGRRNGSASVVSGLADVTRGLFVHTPTNNPADDQLWRIDDNTWTRYSPAFALTTPSVTPADIFVPGNSEVDAVSLHGKLHIACKSTTSGGAALHRIHVYDGATIRRSGLAAPSAAPGVANQGAGALAATERLYRVRYLDSSAGPLRRSEPGPEVSFTPNGTSQFVRVTKPSAVSEGETHWEVELSLDRGAHWYRIATVAVGTSTYDDSETITTIAENGIPSEDIGDYSLIPSAKWLTVDNDRLVYAGNHENPLEDGTVGWSVVGSDTSGIGNDERAPADVGGFLKFNVLDGGGITDVIGWEGKVVVFKRHQIHQMIRTGSRLRGYLPDTISMMYGAIPFSVIEGTDRQSRPCILFVDEDAGPMMYGAEGVKILLDENLRKLWKETFNAAATFRKVSAVFHREKGQAWWHIASGVATAPTVRWVYDAATEGITIHTLPGSTVAATLFQGKPHFSRDTADAANTNRIIRGDDPAQTTDYGTQYRAYVVTRAYQLGQLLQKFEIQSAVLEAGALAATTVSVRVIRDYHSAVEASPWRSVSLAPTGASEYIVKPIDDLALGECAAAQLEFGDEVARDVAAWQIHGFALAWGINSPMTGR